MPIAISHLINRDNDRRRNILFNVTNDDVHRVCDKYLRQCPDRARHAILCDPKQAPQTCSDWQVISLGAAADGQM
jgi:Zn-dependent M16 (insulinase) family peptidase